MLYKLLLNELYTPKFVILLEFNLLTYICYLYIEVRSDFTGIHIGMRENYPLRVIVNRRKYNH